MSQRTERAARDAAYAARQVVSDTSRLSSFRVLRFGRHSSGFFHAEIEVESQRAYVHCKHGSWLRPVDGPGDNHYREVLSPYRDALSERMRTFERAEARARGGDKPNAKKEVQSAEAS